MIYSIQEFYQEVCRRAEEKMQRTGKLEGSHYAAMKSVMLEIESGIITDVVAVVRNLDTDLAKLRCTCRSVALQIDGCGCAGGKAIEKLTETRRALLKQI